MIFQKITSMFPDLNWQTLRYQENPRLRFYFDEVTTDLSEVLQISSKIISRIFIPSEKIYIAITYFSEEGVITNNMKNALKIRWLSKILEFSEEKQILIEDDKSWNYYFWIVGLEDIYSINKVIIEWDFSVAPVIQLHCYYFNESEHILMHLYDDRGMDIISDKKEPLEEIYDSWIGNVPIKKYFN